MTWRAVDLNRDYVYEDALSAGRPRSFVKGMFFADHESILKRHGQPWALKTLAFNDYTEEQYNAIVVAAARAEFPNLPPRRALHALGLLAFPTLRQSLIGKVVFGVTGNDVGAVLGLAPKGYRIATSNVLLSMVKLDGNRCTVAIDGCSLPLEGYQLGVLEGAILSCQRKPGPARVNLDGEYAGEIEVSWT